MLITNLLSELSNIESQTYNLKSNKSHHISAFCLNYANFNPRSFQGQSVLFSIQISFANSLSFGRKTDLKTAKNRLEQKSAILRVYLKAIKP